jgi:phosphoribosylcarboxyaminoimidazole (NCAIR) mutase
MVVGQSLVLSAMLDTTMQRWEYSVFASHLDPAELVVLLNNFGSEGWELVTMVAVTEHHLPEVVELMPSVPTPEPVDVEELIPVDAFRYILKRPLEMGEVRDGPG